MKGQDIALVAAAVAVGWYIAPKEIKEKITSGGGGMALDLSGLFAGINFGGGGTDGGGLLDLSEMGDYFNKLTLEMEKMWSEIPVFNFTPDDFGIPDFSTMFDDFFTKLTDLFGTFKLPDIPEIPKVPNPFDVLPDLPDVTLPIYTKLKTTAERGLSVAAKQYVGAALTGKSLIKPMPLISKWEAVTAPFRAALKPDVVKTVKTVVKSTPESVIVEGVKKGFKVITHGSDDLIEAAAMKTFGKKSIVKAFEKVAPKALVKTIPKGFSRAIPVIGWGLLAVDIGADVARFFGADVTEWLGVSSIIEPVLGYNPLERWVSDQKAKEQYIADTNTMKILSTADGITGMNARMKLAGATAVVSYGDSNKIAGDTLVNIAALKRKYGITPTSNIYDYYFNKPSNGNGGVTFKPAPVETYKLSFSKNPVVYYGGVQGLANSPSWRPTQIVNGTPVYNTIPEFKWRTTPVLNPTAGK